MYNDYNQSVGNSNYPTLFVGDLSVTCDEQRLNELFQSCGVVITSLRIMKNKDNSSLGYGFVNVETVEQAQHAFTSLNGILVCGRYLRLGFAHPLSYPNQNDSINMNTNTNTNSINRYQKHVINARMPYDSQNSIHLKFFIPNSYNSHIMNNNINVDEGIIREIFEERYGSDCINDINIRRIQLENVS